MALGDKFIVDPDPNGIHTKCKARECSILLPGLSNQSTVHCFLDYFFQFSQLCLKILVRQLVLTRVYNINTCATMHDPPSLVAIVCVSADHPYSQPEG